MANPSYLPVGHQVRPCTLPEPNLRMDGLLPSGSKFRQIFSLFFPPMPRCRTHPATRSFNFFWEFVQIVFFFFLSPTTRRVLFIPDLLRAALRIFFSLVLKTQHVLF